MQKAYTKINFKNSPNTSTPLGESILGPMDASIDEIDDRVVAFDLTKANQSDLLTCLSGVTYNSSTGVFVFTFKNGNTVTADLNIEKIPVSFSMDAYGVITMTTSDGTQYTADVGALIKTYTFSDSSEIDFTETVDGSGNKTVTASIVPGSIDGTKLTPNYLADAQAARTGAQTAATRAESWAEGGTGTRTGEDTNNSKYWAQQAQLHSSKHTIEKADGTDMTTRQNLQVIGATITDDPANDRTVITIQGGGHTIENASGTAMTQRDNLQFGGTLQVTDNPTDGATVVDDSAFEISWDDWDAMSAAQQEAFCELHPKVDILDPPSVDGTISAELMKKLWENPSPTSAFAAQSITLSSGDYDFLLWVFKYNKDTDATMSQISSKGNSTTMYYVNSSDVRSRFATRTSDTVFTIADGRSGSLTSSATANNDVCVPLAIYGIKSTINLKLSAIASDVNTAADHCMLSDGVTSVEDELEEAEITCTPQTGYTFNGKIYRKGKLVIATISFAVSNLSASSFVTMGSIPAQYAPSSTKGNSGINVNTNVLNGYPVYVYIDSSGNIMASTNTQVNASGYISAQIVYVIGT